mmetsp:Transcript_6356/g.9264  ORF Transcript_6356/g.9264 Transcript_6356/m.9264 type:complete len:1813 (+) Transcript_6356:78-5516(+)
MQGLGRILVIALILLIFILQNGEKQIEAKKREILIWTQNEDHLENFGYKGQETEYNITNIEINNGTKNLEGTTEKIRKLDYLNQKTEEYGTIIFGSLSITHAIAWTEEGTLLVTGENRNGQLGLGHKEDQRQGFEAVPQTKGENKTLSIISACTMRNATIIVTKEYKVYAMGSNEKGQIGVGPGKLANGDMPTFESPKEVYARGALNNVKINRVACGKATAYAETSTKELIAWGENNHYQIGNGDDETLYFPQKVDGFLGQIKKIEAGYEFAMALMEDQTVYAWGRNWEGQLGLGAPLNDRSVPEKITINENYIVKVIALGNGFSLFLTESTTQVQRIYACGTYHGNPLGLGYTPTDYVTIPTLVDIDMNQYRIADIAAGETFGILTTTNGTLLASGTLDFKKNHSIFEAFTYVGDPGVNVNGTFVNATEVYYGSKIYASKGFLMLERWQCQHFLDSDYSVCGGSGQCFNLEETYCYCDNGYFQENDKSVCSKCAKGKYGVVNGTIMYCESCPFGTYSTVEAAFDKSTCQLCPAGHYTNEKGSFDATHCSSCGAGTYVAPTKDKCLDCPAGSFSALTSQSDNSTCRLCPLGFYSTTPASTSCKACPDGYITIATGSTSSDNCTICPAGTFTFTNSEGTTLCKQCPVGTFSDATGATSEATCSKCPSGSYGNGTLGAFSIDFCIKCPAGTYSDRTGASSIATCNNCTSGTYATEEGLISAQLCQVCPIGTYGSRPGASSLAHCAACPTGTFGEGVGLPSINHCTSCPVQTYQDEVKKTSCKACPVGHFTNGTKKSSLAECLPCPKGTYAVDKANNTIECTSCPIAYFQPFVGKASISDCKPCPAGQYSTIGGLTDVDNCTLCPANTFSLRIAANSSATCQPCPAGEFSNNGSSSCVSCPDGFKIEEVGDGSTRCAPCQPGTYSGKVNNIAACIPCPEGTYSNATQAPSIASCQACPAGTYSNKTGIRFSSECDACPAGTYNTLTGKQSLNDCVKCSKGTSSTTVGAMQASSCEGCIKGTYQPEEGQQNCLKCPAGTYSTVFGSITNDSCNPCSAGTYSSVQGANNAATCQSCPAGTYQPGTGKALLTDCQKCPKATSSNILGATSFDTCKNCSNNFYADEEGLATCKQCPPGTVTVSQQKDSIDSCGECSPGTYAVPEESTCAKCPKGTWNSVPKAPNITFCIKCVAGTYSPTEGATNITVCQQCPAGTASSLPGADNQAACAECTYGSYAPPGSSICHNCSAGTFSNQLFQSSNATCRPCLAGTWSLEKSKSCTACIPGTYSETPAGTSIDVCIACPAGTASNIVGANVSSTCYSCAPGLFSPSVGSTSCTQCNPGYFSPTLQSTFCSECKAGTYSDTKALSYCKSCPPGTFSIVNGSITLQDCRPCAAGSVASLANSTECVKCGDGQFCPRGSSASLPDVQQFIEPLSFIQNPQDVTNGSNQSLVVIKWVPISLIVFMFILMFIIGMVVSCIIEKTCSCKAGFQLFRQADFFFKMHHHVKVDNSPTKRKTIMGGILTIVSCCIILALFYSSTIDLFLDNIILNESFKIGKAEVSNSDISKKSFKARTYFFGNYPNCDEFSISVKGFIGNLDKNGSCVQQEDWNGDKLDNCRCEWGCSECDITGIRQTISFKAPAAFNSILAYEFLVPHYLENDEGKKELYRINGSVVPSSGRVIYGEPEEPTEIYFSVFNSKYIAQSSIAPLMDILVIFGAIANSGSTFDGLTSQHESTVIGGTTIGGLDQNSETKGIYVNFLVDVSKFIFLVEEISKQTTLNYLAQISALSTAVLGSCKLLLMCWEAGFYEGYRRYTKKT